MTNQTNQPATTPTHLRQWETVDCEEIKKLRLIATKASELKRGCDCEYDYRCGRCEDIISIRELAETTLQK